MFIVGFIWFIILFSVLVIIIIGMFILVIFINSKVKVGAFVAIMFFFRVFSFVTNC